MIMDLSESILGNAIISDGKIIEMCRTERLPMPEEERLKNMMIQGVVMTAIPKTNEDYFGEFRTITITHEFMDVVLIPLEDKETVSYLCVLMKAPYEGEEIMSKASTILENFGLRRRNARNDL
jgi:hypothetical protein